MQNKFFLLFLVVIFISCKNSNKENYLLSENINIQDLNDSHPGKKLLETNCYVCHNPTTDHDSRIAPPMIAVKKHYISETTTKQEFISDNDFPETNKVKGEVVSLPMHTELTKKQIKFITNTIISFFE